MFLSDLSIKRPVLITMFLAVFLLFGLLAYFSIPIGLFPDLKIPYVLIETVYPGSGPLVVETQITKKIEDEISALGELDTIISYSMDSVSFIQVQFKLGKDENVAVQEVKDKIDPLISALPSGCERPSISKLDFNSFMPVISLVAEGDLPATELYSVVDTVVKERIAQVEGVGRVQLVGGQEREIRVEFDKRTVFEHSLSLPQIAGLLQAANLEMPGGNFREGNQDVSVRLKGELGNLQELKDMDIPTQAGIRKLRELALVRDGGKEIRQRTTLFDRPTTTRNNNVLVVQAIKVPTGNTVRIVRDIQKKLPSIEKELGGKVRLRTVAESATFVQDSVNDTMTNILLGILLTGFILLVFLHDFRSTFIVAISMPYSIVATFMIMQIMGISFNILSLMGLSTATGILVANSIVVLENIFRHKELGHGRVVAAGKGTSEVTLAVLASTLTNIAVFLPLANMSGMMGVILSNFAYTVVIATVFSIIVSFTLTPMLASRILPEKVKRELWISRWLESVFHSWENGYRKFLRHVLKGKLGSLIILLITVGVLGLTVFLARDLRFEMMPLSDGGRINVAVELPQGASLEETGKVLQALEERAISFPEVKTIVTTLGQLSFIDRDVNMAAMDIALVGRGTREQSHRDISAQLIQAFSDVPNASIRVSPVSETGGAGEAPIDFYLRGPELDQLQEYSRRLIPRLKQIPGLISINTSSRSGKPEITLIPNRKRISEEGITIQDLAVSLRAAVEGLVLTSYKEKGKEYDIRVVLKDETLLTINDLRNIPVATPKRTHPISYFADIQFTESFNKIMHADKYKTVQFSAFLLPGYAQGDLIAPVEEAVKELKLAEGYSMQWTGDTEAFQETMQDLLVVFFLAVILTYMLLAASLESFVQPFLILVTIPLSFLGVILACVLTGTTMNSLSMLSVIMLVGIVVNNAILILDYANQLRRNGLDVREALIEACPVKLKPILMSNLATILGMTPMALGIGASGAEFRAPMGIVSIGGLISSTLLTLFVIPAIENLTARHKKPASQEAGASV
ncbi:MAG: efflux RND transporter permease subunit [Termitinemataceae bacterium]